jgi:glutamyl-tRNA synthetase
VGGRFAPYRQSERRELYREAIARLDTFPCYCSRKELAVVSAPHAGEDGPPYPGTCRNRTAPGNRAPALRFRVPPGLVAFDDGRAGHVEQDVEQVVGDFVVQRADGTPAYQLAVVVDDAAMGIEHVVRGEDLLGSTPRQILLYRALSRPVPRFTHVPLVLDEQGVRLAKRNASEFLAARRERGQRPEDVVGELAASAGIWKGGAVSARDLLARR